ncbi:MAG: hypothetical protein WD894_09435 [Pirellulales bacterium]
MRSQDTRDSRKAGLASALIALTLVALISAFLLADDTETSAPGPLAAFEAYRHFAFLLVVGLIAAFAPYLWLLRRRAIEAAGPLLLRVMRPRIRFWKRVGYVTGGIVLSGYVVLLLIAPLSVADLGSAAAFTIIFVVHVVLEFLGVSRSFLEIHQRGMVCGIAFWLWNQIRDHTWTDGGTKLKLKISGQGLVEFGLDPSMKDELNKLLEAHRHEPQPVG